MPEPAAHCFPLRSGFRRTRLRPLPQPSLLSETIMNSPVTQAHRAFAIETPLPFDTLLINGFEGTEGISQPFHYRVELLADTAFGRHNQVRPENLIGGEMAIRIPLPNEETRFIHGICRTFTTGGLFEERFAQYRCEIVPWFALLDLSSDCRFFQNKTVPEILDIVFRELGYLNFQINTSRSYTAWDYCCQYRETDFQFLSRLMEEEGLIYYFEHHKDRHRMIITDSVGNYEEQPYHATCRMLVSGGPHDQEDVIQSWQVQTELLSSKWTLRDSHHERPRNPLEVELPALHPNQTVTHLETFDSPGGYAKKFNEPEQRLDMIRPEGEIVNRLLMETEEVKHRRIQGESDVRALTSGYKIKLDSLLHTRVEGEYLLTHVEHRAVQSPGYVTGHNLTGAYSNKFHAIPADVVFRCPRRTPKPLIQGPHTAFVVDENEPNTEEIWPDKYGRVRVQFLWDRKAKYSCWLRVAQPWAGRGWGHQWIPRVGDEVLVDFVEGDPDQPIVIGSVYNQKNMPPFALPQKKTQSGIVTRSTLNGNNHQFNMLRFDDQKGAEQVMIRSQRRGDVRVYGNYFETNHANRETYVGWKDERTEESGGDHNHTINGDHNKHILKGLFVGIDKQLNQTVTAEVVEDHQASQATLVTNKAELNAKEIIFEATTKIGLKCGPSFISIEPSGITIYGPMVKINSGGYGTETGDPYIEFPFDAALSDNGEPGYLDRHRGTGGGPRRRSGRRLRSQHYVYPPRPGESAAFTAMRNTLNTSAQGRHALEVFERNGVNVTANPGGTVYSDSTNTVNLDPARTDSPASQFVHEMGHAQAHHDGTSANVHTQDRADYIDTQLREDANAERRAYEAEQQMNDAGGSESYNSITRTNYQNAYNAERARLQAAEPGISEEDLNRRSHDAAEAAILEDYRRGRITTGNTTPPQSYVDYWGGDWDRRHGTPPAGGGSGPAPHPHAH
jgi:type VI secretion system secreted protein VgrG